MFPNLDGVLLDQKYRVIRRLGHGAFGDVYLAHDPLPDRHVAIKRVRESNSQNLASFIHEMRSLDQLHHHNIVRFLAYFIENESLFIVMDYCPGGSLSSHIVTKRPSVATTMQWGQELANVLGQVHRLGIVHHDLKPDNILFGADGEIRVSDFGAANRRIGTILYMSPEMYRGESALNDGRVDIYALGITLLEVLLGELPFADLSHFEIQNLKLRHDFIPLDMERWLQEVLARATHPDPELRFQTMEEFSEAITAKHVNYVFQAGRIQSHRLATLAERSLANKRISAALRYVRQAKFASEDCVAAIVAEGRCHLFMNHLHDARLCFDRALQLNPRIHLQRELGWLNLEAGNYARAISLLTDHLQRRSDDYEAYNLLLECFYRTERFEAGIDLAKLMMAESAPGTCFANNALLCELRAGITQKEEAVHSAMAAVTTPFLTYNMGISRHASDRLARLLIFQNYRFGLGAQNENVIGIKLRGVVSEFVERLVTVGWEDRNHISLKERTVSRRHCAIVNYPGDVWVYDLGSSSGILVDGRKIDGKAYLDGVHSITIGGIELTVSAAEGRLL